MYLENATGSKACRVPVGVQVRVKKKMRVKRMIQTTIRTIWRVKVLILHLYDFSVSSPAPPSKDKIQ